jgi:hypothetical protein
MGVVTPSFRSIRGSFRRAMRSTAIRAIDFGVMETIARAISAFDRRRGLYLQGRIIGVARRRVDHTDFWQAASQRYPTDAAFLRQAIHSALRAGRLADAEAGMSSLLAARRTDAADGNFVLGLAYIYQQRGDHAAIRRLVRSFLKSLRSQPDRRVAGLRLSRLLLTFFARTRNPDVGAEHQRSHRQLATMIERAGMQPEPMALLQRVVRIEEGLAGQCPPALFDTDVSRSQCSAFVRLVRSRVVAGEPFSLVRIGDGEAACLPYEPDLRWLAEGDAIERERIWWGSPLTQAQRRRTTRLVLNATWSADCIGIPTVSRFLRELRLTENDRLDNGLTGRGLRSILYSVEHYKAFRGVDMSAPVFTSCHLHQDLERWDLYRELLEGKTEIVLVSCHSDLADLVGTKFGAKVAFSLILPPDRVSAPALKHGASDARRLPDILDDVVGQVREVSRGRLVLVGAGYLGKWLVDVARAQGAVALDVGSVFDYWLGLNTRSYLDLNPL